MADKHGISNESGPDAFADALASIKKKMAESALSQRSYEVECPLCKGKMQLRAGAGVCPHCGNSVKPATEADWTKR